MNPIHIISLGAGVQSSVLALMASAGEIIPKPIAAAFADTKWERLKTYLWLRWLCGCEIIEFEPGRWCAVEGVWSGGVLDFPVSILSDGDLRSEQINARVRGCAEKGERWASLPYFTMQAGATKEGKIKRQCTAEYKIEPIEKWMKQVVLGLAPRSRLPTSPGIVQWRGISTDEISRLKDSREPWYSVRYPLALELQMSRNDCARWLWEKYRKIAPRSACIGCPFHSDAEWRDIKETPSEWQDATEFDQGVRKAGGMRGDTYLHRSCKPLAEVDLSTEEQRGQLNMFNNECEGMCGV
jgi:hypothetical protein